MEESNKLILNEASKEESATDTLKGDESNALIDLNATSKRMFVMQNSTDTLVDEMTKIAQKDSFVKTETKETINGKLVNLELTDAAAPTSPNPHFHKTHPLVNELQTQVNVNNVSTSTSGLPDFVAFAKFRYINDRIRHFNEKNFNEENLFNFDNSNESNKTDLSRKNSTNGNSEYSELNGDSESNANGPKRAVSKSIPIQKKKHVN